MIQRFRIPGLIAVCLMTTGCYCVPGPVYGPVCGPPPPPIPCPLPLPLTLLAPAGAHLAALLNTPLCSGAVCGAPCCDGAAASAWSYPEACGAPGCCDGFAPPADTMSPAPVPEPVPAESAPPGAVQDASTYGVNGIQRTGWQQTLPAPHLPTPGPGPGPVQGLTPATTPQSAGQHPGTGGAGAPLRIPAF